VVKDLTRSLDNIKGILLDRDGTVNVERADYVRSVEQFVLLPGVIKAFAELAVFGLPVVVVTNQSAIARGLISERDLESIHEHLSSVARKTGLELRGILVCPHHPEAGCPCRKPRPGLLLCAAAQLGIRPEECLMIGDSINDFLAARAAGAAVIMVRSGRQGGQLDALFGDPLSTSDPPPIVQGLLDAVRLAGAALGMGDNKESLQLTHAPSLAMRG
jgi:D-glycero-D-manno-heptose 1,7-bisphosphate phosphatase